MNRHIKASSQMIDRPYVEKREDFAQVWDALETCHSQGVYIYDDETRRGVYRTYAELVARAGLLAGVLASYGIGRGDRVLFCAATTPNFPLVWLALLWLGAVPVPMPPRMALIGQYTFRERIDGIIRHFPFYLCDGDELDEVMLSKSSQRASTSAIPLNLVYAQIGSNIDTPARISPDLDDTAFVQFTSGSTKAPKGILITYRNLYANVHSIWSRLQAEPGVDKFASWLPLYHDMGLVGKFLGCLLTQTDLVLMSPQAFARRPLNFLKALDEQRATVCSMPNFALEWILRRLSATPDARYSLGSMRWLGVGAEPINPETLVTFDGVLQEHGLKKGVVSPCYGLAEATLAVSIAPPGETYELYPCQGSFCPTAGRPLIGIEVKIGDSAADSYGQIKIRGDSIAKTALVDGRIVSLVDEHGFYDTKDIGGLIKGQMVVLGRSDEMFIVNGENYFPYDIESIARRSEGVVRNRVVCFQEQRERGAVVVLYESRPLPAGEQEEIVDEIVRNVRASTGLSDIVVRGVPPKSIPVTPSGKIQRLRARKLFSEGYYELHVDADGLAVNEGA